MSGRIEDCCGGVEEASSVIGACKLLDFTGFLPLPLLFQISGGLLYHNFAFLIASSFGNRLLVVLHSNKRPSFFIDELLEFFVIIVEPILVFF